MVTMKDIANEVGVSRPTVSLVLNSRDTNVRISDSTRDEIHAAARRLGYRPNELARSIKTEKTNIVGFIGGAGGSKSFSKLGKATWGCANSTAAPHPS